MLSPKLIELIHREIDGENTPEASAELRSLTEHDPEARALAAELREVAALLDRVEQRATPPPPHLRQAILDAVPPPAPRPQGLGSLWITMQEFFRESVSSLQAVTLRMGESMMAKKALVIGSTVVAAIAIVAVVIVGYPPTGREAGTIGGLRSDSIAGVQQAGRYRNRSISERDVTLDNPDVQALFQNDEILTLVKSDAFRTAMRNDAFRELQSNEMFRKLMSTEAYRELQSNAAYRELQSNALFRELQAQAASRTAQNTEAMRMAQNTEAMHALQNSEAFHQLQANAAYRQLLANDAFRELQANAAFRELMANDAFRSLLANDAYRQLLSAELFRAVSRNAQMSELFMSAAMRMQQ
ncbi:MAG TPA: hypothetical protein VJ867_16345 [Gemmatimonadaceae bacterium]|nr:hypothetical protein [Gemmatimonadaceae bacterium]